MSNETRGMRSGGWRATAAKLGAAAGLALLLLGACAHLAMMRGADVQPPPASEFGFGPRASAAGTYRATLEPAEPLRTRRLHALRLTLRTGDGAPVEDAAVTVDGGMPQHGHGLPTQPRVTRSLGGGAYQVEGVKFNMGGWWELTFHVASAAGTDRVTFNLDL